MSRPKDPAIRLQRAAAAMLRHDRKTTRERDAALMMLRRCRAILAQTMRFHLDSVTMGKLEPVADCGVIDLEAQRGRDHMEKCDTLLADIDKRFPYTPDMER